MLQHPLEDTPTYLKYLGKLGALRSCCDVQIPSPLVRTRWCWFCRPDLQGDGDRVKDGESCLVLIGETAGEELQTIYGAVEDFLSVRHRAELQNQSSLLKSIMFEE